MAKIAGRKNDAAWQAANNWMYNADPNIVADLTEQIEAQPEIATALSAITSAYQSIDVPLPTQLATVTSWISWMTANGWPWDVWIGKAAYDIYAYNDPPAGGKATYTPMITPALAKAASVIRHIVKQYQFGIRQIIWLFSETHPPSSRVATLAARRADKVGWTQQRVAQIAAARAARREARTATRPGSPDVEKKPLTKPKAKI